jgi:hypothetical protein
MRCGASEFRTSPTPGASGANFGIKGALATFAVRPLDLKVRIYVRLQWQDFKSITRGLSRNPIRSP